MDQWTRLGDGKSFNSIKTVKTIQNSKSKQNNK